MSRLILLPFGAAFELGLLAFAWALAVISPAKASALAAWAKDSLPDRDWYYGRPTAGKPTDQPRSQRSPNTITHFRAHAQGKTDPTVEVVSTYLDSGQRLMTICAADETIYITQEQAMAFFNIEEQVQSRSANNRDAG